MAKTKKYFALKKMEMKSEFLIQISHSDRYSKIIIPTNVCSVVEEK